MEKKLLMTNVINITKNHLTEKDIISYRLKCFEKLIKTHYNEIQACKLEITRLKVKLKTLKSD